MVPCKLCKYLLFADCPRCVITREPVEPDQYCDHSEPSTEEIKPIEIQPVCQGPKINNGEKAYRRRMLEQIKMEARKCLDLAGRDIKIVGKNVE